jgi:hypothetical protein
MFIWKVVAPDPAGSLLADLGLPAHIGRMADPQFRYFFNAQTGRWDVVWKRPDGTETVVGAYSTRAEAMEHVSRANNAPVGPPSSP